MGIPGGGSLEKTPVREKQSEMSVYCRGPHFGRESSGSESQFALLCASNGPCRLSHHPASN